MTAEAASPTAPDLVIGPVGNDELADIVALWRACDLVVPWNDPAADIAQCRSHPASALLVGRVDGRPVATVMVGHDGHRGWIYYLAVDPAWRRRGFGRRTLEAAEDWLRGRHVPKLLLMIRETNTEVQGFYRALGFEANPVAVMGKWLRK